MPSEDHALRDALEKDAVRFERCADMIAASFNASGTLRTARHYALEVRAAPTQEKADNALPPDRDPCPTCGALPCDWVNDPFATPTPAPIDNEALVEEVARAISSARDNFAMTLPMPVTDYDRDIARAVLALPSIARHVTTQNALVREVIGALEKIAETPNNGWMIARATLAKLKEGRA